MKRLLSILLALGILLTACAWAEGEGEVKYSLTTGLPTDHEYKPMVVQMDNEPGARPQCGISDADVVYETEVYRGGYTRYTVVFNDTIPAKVEAVRSARIHHLNVYLDWGGAFVNFGFQTAEGTDAQAYAKKVAQYLYNGLVMAETYFYRDSARKAPNNVICNLPLLYAKMTDPVPEHSPLSFSDTPTQKGDRVSVFRIPYNKDNGYYPSYQWDEAQHKYVRYYNRADYVDGFTGQQVTCDNVIVQYVSYTWYAGDGNRPVVGDLGTNRCEYFIGGYHFTGYWVRDSYSGSTVYYDDDGQVVKFARGKTFIQMLRDSERVEIAQ